MAMSPAPPAESATESAAPYATDADLLNVVAARLSLPSRAGRSRELAQGMATLISPTLAITPDHVARAVQQAGARTVALTFDRLAGREGPREVRARIAAQDERADLAVVRLEEPVTVEGMPATWTSWEVPLRGSTWTSLWLIPAAPDGAMVTGEVLGLTEVEGRQYLHLRASERTPESAGVSGAPVIVDGRVVGIIALGNQEDSEWFAMPTAYMVGERTDPRIRTLLEPAIRPEPALESADAPPDTPDQTAQQTLQTAPDRVPTDGEAGDARGFIAGYRSDAAEGDDLLGITPEVEALCGVLAAKDVQPPLSLGLFGDWGSGKSFFMGKMQQRIQEITDAARAANGEGPYCAEIVQLRFNAWYYIDKDLWASLAAEIFEGLAAALERRSGEDASRQRARLLAATASSKDVLAEAERRKAEAEAELQQTQQRMQRLESAEADVEASLSPQAILREAYAVAVQDQEVKQHVEAAAKALNLPGAQAAATKAGAELLELRGLWGGVRATWIALRHGRSRRIWLLSLVLTLAAVFALSLIVPWVVERGIPAAIAQATSLLLAAVSFAGPFIRRAKQALDVLTQARRRSEETVQGIATQRKAELQAEQEQIRTRLSAAQEQAEEVAKEVKQLERTLDDLRADRQMSTFIRERYESTDYTKHFGTIARARNDFERLSSLMDKVRAQAEAQRVAGGKALPAAPGGAGAAGDSQAEGEAALQLPQIDRIILYIDDLDRCPEDKVVDVLQAVHLLLAFPLFVVVVGVDPRWMLHSLKRHSRAFSDGEDGENEEERTHWQSTPMNYVEKIFQIPFTLRPIQQTGFTALIDSLAAEPGGQAGVALARPVSENGAANAAMPLPLESDEDVAHETDAEPREPDVPVEPFAGQDRAQAAVSQEVSPTILPDQGAPDDEPDALSTSPRERSSPVDMNPEYLRIEPWERDAMKRLHRLIPSPRAAKRFVNIYRLLRASVPAERRDAFIGGEGEGKGDGVGEYRAALLLLAIQTGYPAEETTMLRSLLEERHEEAWWDFVDTFWERSVPAGVQARVAASAGEGGAAPGGPASGAGPHMNGEVSAGANGGLPDGAEAEAERWEQLLKKLTEIRHAGSRPGDEERPLIPEEQSCRDFTRWAAEVARYSFQSGRVLLSQRRG